jgi:sRNA-binding protein
MMSGLPGNGHSLFLALHAHMNATANDTPDNAAPAPAEASANPPAAAPRGQRPNRGRRPQRPAGERPAGPAPSRQHPVLDQLASLYPALFGEVLKPLKRGIFQDLLEAHPEAIDKDGLKAALALHTRSTRYLTVVASGQQRHNLAGEPVEDLTPEQVHHALIEVFRRRASRGREDLRPKLRQRILQAFEASGLSREDYAARVLGRDEPPSSSSSASTPPSRAPTASPSWSAAASSKPSPPPPSPPTPPPSAPMWGSEMSIYTRSEVSFNISMLIHVALCDTPTDPT